ncbi:MAG: HAMP domain-containing histidine kinase [Clostridia bacterium]|nr:HAMP domain-containing histidine kinase [Clostridia bacterium]
MIKNKNIIISIIIITIMIVIINSVIVVNLHTKYQKALNNTISSIIGEISKSYPQVEEEQILKILNNQETEKGIDILQKYGIDVEQISALQALENQEKEFIISSNMSIIIFFFLVCIILLVNAKKREKKINEIIKYIQEINMKNYNLKIEENTEDELSNLKNELYKITVMLKEQADLSLKGQKSLQTSIEDISHQLKTPLTSISIMLDNIIDNPNMQEQTRQNFIYEINRQIEWINWLVISLLKLSKLDSNTAIFVKKEINIKTLVENVIKNLSIPIDIKQHNIIVKGENVKIIADYNWQLEAITNIVKNCIEHTQEGKNIYISFEENVFYTKIVIQDEGIGIDKEDIKHIFERFYKGKNSSEKSVGIGLALSKKIIEKDNGFIICSSKINEGTTFEIKYMKS